MLSGKAELFAYDTAAIRDAGEHLLAFAGPEHVTCFGCGGENGEHFDCPVFQPGAKNQAIEGDFEWHVPRSPRR